ncbi:DUF4097 family beta strand repeat-containing protein [Streptomyces sp. enrichment culture]|uniref:DUF4097 family beta strand repeat-containing protein n=1 Tax=Streptomyces sp. enrichment culture TaxID=1795815 RepID=UPI003F559E99
MTRTHRTTAAATAAAPAPLPRRRTGRVRAVAVVGAAAVLVAGLAGCGASAADDTEPERRTFGLTGTTLTVDSDDSALEIVAADAHPSGKIRVTRWFRGRVVIGSDPKVSWSLKDDRLVLRLKCSGIIADCAARHRVEVPRGIAVTVHNRDGSVRAGGFTDPLNVRTGDGSVHVTDTSGPLELHSGDGSVRAEVSSRTVRTRSGDGSVRLALRAVPDRVESHSGDGSVTIELPRAAYKVDTRTGDGPERVSVPRDDASRHVVTARTGDGSLTVRTVN